MDSSLLNNLELTLTNFYYYISFIDKKTLFFNIITVNIGVSNERGVSMKMKVYLLKVALVVIALFASFITLLLSIQFFSAREENVFTTIFFLTVILSVLLGFRVLYLLNEILNYINGSIIFSNKTLAVVSQIKRIILVISVVFLGILPFFYHVADQEDAPGVMIIGCGFVVLPFIAYVFSQIVEELFKHATQLKLDNELTI